MPETNPAHPDVLSCLPHGPEFRYLDEVLELNPGVGGVGRWSPVGSEPFFAGHFPGNPVVPGVLIGEALAQMSGVVGFTGDGTPSGGMLAQIDLRLKRPVTPPADIELHATLARRHGPLGQFDVQARCQGATVARGSLTLVRTQPGETAP